MPNKAHMNLSWYHYSSDCDLYDVRVKREMLMSQIGYWMHQIKYISMNNKNKLKMHVIINRYSFLWGFVEKNPVILETSGLYIQFRQIDVWINGQVDRGTDL